MGVSTHAVRVKCRQWERIVLNLFAKWVAASLIAMALLIGLVSSAFAAQSQEGPAEAVNTIVPPNGKQGNVRGVILAVAVELEVNVGEVIDDLNSGLTLAEIIEDNDGSVRKVVGALVDRQRDKLQWAVDEDLMSRRQMRDRLKQLKTGYTNLMHSEHLADLDKLEYLMEAQKRQRAITVIVLIRGVSQALDLESADIIAEMRDGSTLVEIIEDNDSTVEEVVDFMVEQARSGLLKQFCK